MNKIIISLLTVLFIQLLSIGYLKFIYEPTLKQKSIPKITKIRDISCAESVELDELVNRSIQEIMTKAKSLPKSKEYSTWDKEMIAHVGKKILKQHIKQKITQKEDKKKIKKQTKKSKEKIVKKISKTKKIEEFAKKKLGDKYVWGATGPNKFDCSGFTREVFRCSTGICIPRVSREQAKVGQYITYKNLQRGDMVFFDTEKKFTKRVNHVGIYLSNGNFIHASSARKKVIITNFNKKPFYKRRFLWGRRLLKN
jgi:cell wall-associated NlpC family hydrolase